MPVLSILRKEAITSVKKFVCSDLCKAKSSVINGIRLSGNYDPRKMYIHPSSWQWHKFKDFFHFYFMLGAIPLTALTTYINIKIGPAQLREIPEDYEPKIWEYYKNPIERWFARFVYPTHEDEYERYMQVVYEEDEKRCMREITRKVRFLREHRQDTRDAPSFQTMPLEYFRAVRKEYEFETKNYGNR